MWVGLHSTCRSFNTSQISEIVWASERQTTRDRLKNQLLDGGDAEKVILLGLHTMMKASINILQHMKNSLEVNYMQLSFWPQGKTFDEALKELSADDGVKRV